MGALSQTTNSIPNGTGITSLDDIKNTTIMHKESPAIDLFTFVFFCASMILISFLFYAYHLYEKCRRLSRGNQDERFVVQYEARGEAQERGDNHQHSATANDPELGQITTAALQFEEDMFRNRNDTVVVRVEDDNADNKATRTCFLEDTVKYSLHRMYEPDEDVHPVRQDSMILNMDAPNKTCLEIQDKDDTEFLSSDDSPPSTFRTTVGSSEPRRRRTYIKTNWTTRTPKITDSHIA